MAIRAVFARAITVFTRPVIIVIRRRKESITAFIVINETN